VDQNVQGPAGVVDMKYQTCLYLELKIISHCVDSVPGPCIQNIFLRHCWVTFQYYRQGIDRNSATYWCSAVSVILASVWCL